MKKVFKVTLTCLGLCGLLSLPFFFFIKFIWYYKSGSVRRHKQKQRGQQVRAVTSLSSSPVMFAERLLAGQGRLW